MLTQLSTFLGKELSLNNQLSPHILDAPVPVFLTPSTASSDDLQRPRSLTLSANANGEDNNEDAEAMLELQNIMKLKNTADWGMMSMSLKSLSRRISRRTTSVGESPDLKVIEAVSVAGFIFQHKFTFS